MDIFFLIVVVTALVLLGFSAGRGTRFAGLQKDAAAAAASGRSEARPAPDAQGRFLALIQVNRFIVLRRTIGFAIASALLEELAQRARASISGATIGRIGRSTIEVSFPAADADTAHELLTELGRTLERRIDVEGIAIDVSLTIGAVPEDGTSSIEELVERTQIACEAARRRHVHIAFYDPAEEAEITSRLALLRDLKSACTDGSFFLCYQPKLDVRTASIPAAEALLRWRHSERGLIPPDIFIPLAEETGEIRAVTQWVIDRALADHRRLAEAGHVLKIDVNISGLLLADADFVDWLLALARGHPDALGLEITETAIISDPETALANLDRLVAAGLHIAIDDYGSGLSSLAYLKQLPAHELKIDKLFVSGLTTSHRDPLLVRSSIDLAHALDMKVTAEGVDNGIALSLLKVMGCDLIQGYFVAAPLTYDELYAFLASDAHVAKLAAPKAPWAMSAKVI